MWSRYYNILNHIHHTVKNYPHRFDSLDGLVPARANTNMEKLQFLALFTSARTGLRDASDDNFEQSFMIYM